MEILKVDYTHPNVENIIYHSYEVDRCMLTYLFMYSIFFVVPVPCSSEVQWFGNCLPHLTAVEVE